ncbi:MAG TPA: hypothetical protein VGJ39_00220 [Vicinamibacterales bacterium]|jgi:hypothetical protein
MTELRHISFNLGASGIKATEQLLRTVGVSADADLHIDGVLAGLCSVTLEADDARFPALLAALQEQGATPLIRAERRYSDSELAAFPWLLLRVTTAGLAGGVNLGQPYDYTRACSTCGAGAEPIPPLLAALGSMGRKAIDRTAHDGHVIVTRQLADAIEAEGLTGVEFLPVTRAPEKSPDPRFRWMRIPGELEPLAPTSVVATEDRCPSCGRAGHFDALERATELRYSGSPTDDSDFSYTWEYFGVWRRPAGVAQDFLSAEASATAVSPAVKSVGGARLPIVSHYVRALFRRLKVRGVAFEPVWRGADSGA